MHIIDGVVKFGFSGSDIWSNVLLIVGSVSGFLLVGICIRFAPIVFDLIRHALYMKKTHGSVTMYGLWDEGRAMYYNRRDGV
ncbi:hypothetical protein NYE44_30565 [Paenibacillus sp. FSL L8-0493]|uniref:hypothetical protein n=1 Tax=Paenibacillus sp. FSL L8-0493 TaxID=2975333 RepID=UPI0030FD2B08